MRWLVPAYERLPSEGRGALRRVVLAGVAVSAAFVAFQTVLDSVMHAALPDDLESLLLRVLVLAGTSALALGVALRIALRVVAQHLLALEAAHEARSRARLEGVRLAASTLEHHLGNQLALTVGYGELLAEHPRLPSDLVVHAHSAIEGARAATETVGKLSQVRRVETLDVGGPEILDLERSLA